MKYLNFFVFFLQINFVCLFSIFYKIKVFSGDYKIKVDFYQCFKGILLEQCVVDVSTCAILSEPENVLHL